MVTTSKILSLKNINNNEKNVHVVKIFCLCIHLFSTAK